MPLERLVAFVVVIIVALVDYVGILKPVQESVNDKVREEIVIQDTKKNADISISQIGRHAMDEIFPIICKVVNTGEQMHTFVVSVEISSIGERKIFPIKKVSLEPGESQDIPFEYKVSKEDKEGKCIAYASVWESEERGSLANRYAKYEEGFILFDALPEISFLDLGLSARVGEKLNLKVRVKDDRGVRWVKITYQSPGMTQKYKTTMNRKSGDTKNGIWVFTTDPPRQTGQFVFLIEAMDINSRIASTDEYKIAVVTK